MLIQLSYPKLYWMFSWLRPLRLGLICLALLLWSFNAHSAEHGDEDVLWHPYIEIGGAVGNARNRAEMRIFAPVFQDSRRMLFADLRGNYFSSPAGEGNIGLGYRQRFSLNAGDTDNAIYGLYGFVDIHNSSYDNVFYQTTLGGEILTQDFDLRLNGYIPLNYSNKDIRGAGKLVSTDSNIFIRGGREKPLYGVSGEVGARLWHNNKSELRLWGGGFYFSNSDVETIAGPRARAEWRLFDLFKPGARLSLAGQVRWDDVRHTDGEIGLRLRFPLGGPSYRANHRLDGLDRRMVDPIHRIDDIITQAGPYGPPEPAKLSLSGQQFKGLKTVDANTNWSDVLTPAPVTAAGTGSTAVVSGQGKLLVLDGSKGPIEAGILIVGSDSLISGGQLVEFKSETTGDTYSLQLPGTKATLVHDSQNISNSIVSVAASSTGVLLSNLIFDGQSNGGNAIDLGVGSKNITIDSVNISNINLDMFALAAFGGHEQLTINKLTSDGFVELNAKGSAPAGDAEAVYDTIAITDSNFTATNRFSSLAPTIHWYGSNGQMSIKDSSIQSSGVGTLTVEGGDLRLTMKSTTITPLPAAVGANSPTSLGSVRLALKDPYTSAFGPHMVEFDGVSIESINQPALTFSSPSLSDLPLLSTVSLNNSSFRSNYNTDHGTLSLWAPARFSFDNINVDTVSTATNSANILYGEFGSTDPLSPVGVHDGYRMGTTPRVISSPLPDYNDLTPEKQERLNKALQRTPAVITPNEAAIIVTNSTFSGAKEGMRYVVSNASKSIPIAFSNTAFNNSSSWVSAIDLSPLGGGTPKLASFQNLRPLQVNGNPAPSLTAISALGMDLVADSITFDGSTVQSILFEGEKGAKVQISNSTFNKSGLTTLLTTLSPQATVISIKGSAFTKGLKDDGTTREVLDIIHKLSGSHVFGFSPNPLNDNTLSGFSISELINDSPVCNIQVGPSTQVNGLLQLLEPVNNLPVFFQRFLTPCDPPLLPTP